MFTRNKFKQLFYIDKEIKEYQQEIKNIEAKGEKCTQVLSDMPKASKVSRKIEDAAVDAVEVLETISYALEKREREKARLMEAINRVEDAEMRLILFYRYAQCMSWGHVAKKLNSTPEAVRAKDKRFFTKN